MDQNEQVAKTLSEAAALATKVAELEQKVVYLSERQHVIDMYRRYTRGLNRYDLELLNSTFWPDAQINYGFRSYLRDEWISLWKEKRYLKGLACQAHHITNETVDIAGDVAHVESYLIAFWRPLKDDNSALIIGGRYIDRIDRRIGEWRIAVREFIPHFWTNANSVFNSTFSETSWPQFGMGASDKSDPCYRRPLNPRPKEDVERR
jgi:hypothetical protein